MTEQEIELVAAQAADIAVTRFREILRNELKAVVDGVASLDPAFIDQAMCNWIDKEIHKTMQHNGMNGDWIPAHYTVVEKLTQAMGGTNEFKTVLSNIFRNARF